MNGSDKSEDMLDDDINLVGAESNMEIDGTIRFKSIERGGFDSFKVYEAIFKNWIEFKAMIEKIPPSERKHQYDSYAD